MPAPGLVVDPASDRVLLDQGPTHARIGAPIGLAPAQQVTVDAVGGQFVGGQVHPSALQVFVDIPEEVGQLERLSERGGVRRGILARADGAQNRQQLQTRSPPPSRTCSGPARARSG